MDATRFIESLLRSAAANRIPLSHQQAELCFRHVALMLEWNRRLNLTRITDFKQILTKHLLDSLLPATWLPQAGYAMDVGSGAGFPGVPLQIYCPGLQMVLLEAVRKKVSFLKVLTAKLALENLQAEQGRWEELIRTALPVARPRYSLVTMRAVRFEPDHLTRLAATLLTPGGMFAWWAGPSSETLALPTESELRGSGMAFAGDHHYTLPGPAAEPRHILLWRKVTGTGPAE